MVIKGIFFVHTIIIKTIFNLLIKSLNSKIYFFIFVPNKINTY